MKKRGLRPLVVLILLGVTAVTPASAQTPPRPLSEAECRAARDRLAEHARLSEGVRRAVAARAAATPAQPAPIAAPAPASGPTGRSEVVRARLERIRVERQRAEDGRLGALARFDFSRVAQYQAEVTALDAERTRLEQELASLPAGGATPAPVQAPARPAGDTEQLRCADMMATHDEAVRIRQRELGAKEGQAGVVPLLPLRGQSAADVAREIAVQMPEGSGAQVGLLDADGDGRTEAFIDTPARGTYRLYRQRPDGTLSVEVFSLGTASPAPYGEIPRRLDETTARQLGRSLSDLLAVRPTGAVRVTAETPDFAPAHAQWLAGNYAEAAKLERPAARGVEYQNLRGETVRVIEVLAPMPNGLVLRQLVATPRPGDQEQWDETVTTVRPVSFWRTEVELSTGRETRAAGGVPVGTRATAAPMRFSIDR